jgi:hypothetical protein
VAKANAISVSTAPIKPVPNDFDDNFLDVIGIEFKFDHAKGLAEWLKNSADAYSTTAKVKDSEQYILLRFKQGNPKRDSVFECIDFVGMAKEHIDKALKVWGLATAAKRGTDVATYGGHGNGGKFYMRQMFASSRFITYRGGLLNVFGFDERKRYGYAKGLENFPLKLNDALKFANIDYLEIPVEVRNRWKKSPKSTGFTIVHGEHPEKFSGRATVSSILEKLRLHPQARRLLAHKQVFFLPSWESQWGEPLRPPTLAPRPGFEEPRTIELPKSLQFEEEVVELRNRQYPKAKLILRTSDTPLARYSDHAALNSVDILGEIGCIGSYRMNELGFLRFGPEAEFIYGECTCPILEDERNRSVRNDREKLVDNILTRALLDWIRNQVDLLAEEMTEKHRKEKKSRDLRQSSLFNQVLDRWKNRFMTKLTGELFGGSGIGDTFGGSGAGKTDKIGGSGGSTSGGGGNTGTGEGGGGAGNEPKKGPRFPRVLLSGYDSDPLDENADVPFEVDERQPPIYQRDVDTNEGIYWINTARPLASKIMDSYGASSARWREYLFQRYIDIILKQSVYELGRHDSNLAPYKIDGLIDDVTSRVHDAAAQELEQFLFDESLTGSAATGTLRDASDEI